MPSSYVPDTGDIIWLDFDPSAGHEQAGHRPALVLSPKRYNGKTGLLICVPLTSRIKGFPFEVEFQDGSRQGVALADQVKSLDWRVRNAQRKGKADNEVVSRIRTKIKLLLQLT
ncbi:MAG: endoribonuclease MazF [Gammaproteobacteria bacterium]|nr:endoribonuclease MazF [Gammaproteobacteria bacterium]